MSDREYRLSSVFDHFRGNLTAADLFTQSVSAAALAAAERALPVLDPAPVADSRPLARPPRLPDVPRPPAATAGPDATGLAVSTLALAAGMLVFTRGRR
jgi:nitrous oxidase accessory protein